MPDIKNIFIYTILVINNLVIPSLVSAQVAELSVSVNKDTILIGESVDLEIRIIKNKNANVSFPALKDTIIKGIEILNISAIDTIQMGDEQILRQKILITGFDSGYFNIPSFNFPVELNNVKDTISSVPVSLQINLPEIDSGADFRDIKPAINTPVNFREALPYILIGLGIIILFFLSYYFILKNRKKHSGIIDKTPSVPAYIIALDQLQQLRIQKTWESKNIKEYYTKLSGIVRTYLENQFSINALELTTLEILMDFELLYGKDNEIKSKLEELLELSDLVKFAKEAPSSVKNLENLDKATVFVELTQQKIQTEENNSESDLPDKL